MRLVYEKNFLKSARLLPAPIQRLLAEQLQRLQADPRDPRLHSKMLSGSLSNFLSFRITRDYRTIFQYIDHNTIQLLIVKHRKDIYR